MFGGVFYCQVGVVVVVDAAGEHGRHKKGETMFSSSCLFFFFFFPSFFLVAEIFNLLWFQFSKGRPGKLIGCLKQY